MKAGSPYAVEENRRWHDLLMLWKKQMKAGSSYAVEET